MQPRPAWLVRKRLPCGPKAQAGVVTCIQAEALTIPGTLLNCTLQRVLVKATCIANPVPTWSGAQHCALESQGSPPQVLVIHDKSPLKPWSRLRLVRTGYRQQWRICFDQFLFHSPGTLNPPP